MTPALLSTGRIERISVETRLTPCPYNALYQEARTKMTSADYAAVNPTTRSWSETVFKLLWLTDQRKKLRTW